MKLKHFFIFQAIGALQRTKRSMMSQSTDSRSQLLTELYLSLPSIKEENIYTSSSDEEGYGPSIHGSPPNLTPTKSTPKPGRDMLDLDFGFSSDDDAPVWQGASGLDPCDPRYYLDPSLPGFNLDFTESWDVVDSQAMKRSKAAKAFNVKELYVEQVTPKQTRNLARDLDSTEVELENLIAHREPDHQDQMGKFVENDSRECSDMSSTYKDIQKNHITEFWTPRNGQSSLSMDFSENTLQYAKPLLRNALAVEVYEEINDNSGDDEDIEEYLRECGLECFTKEEQKSPSPLDENQNHMLVSANCLQTNQLYPSTMEDFEILSRKSSSCDSIDDNVEEILNQTLQKSGLDDIKHADDEIDDIIAVNRINGDVRDADLSIDDVTNDSDNSRIGKQTFDLSYMDEFYDEMFYPSDEGEIDNCIKSESYESKLQVSEKRRRSKRVGRPLDTKQAKQSQVELSHLNNVPDELEDTDGQFKHETNNMEPAENNQSFSILADASATFDEAIAVVMDFFIGAKSTK